MLRNFFVFLALCALFAFTANVRGGPEEGVADATEGATYIGEKKCKKCHMKQHRTWKKMKHKNAWDLLTEEYRKPDAKDDDGRACISCHVTGYGQGERGGFVDAVKSEHLLGVQCEACHGPGSKHVVVGKKLTTEKRGFNEGEKSFITRRTTACSGCHNPHINHSKYKAE